MSPFLGEIRWFAGVRVPHEWALCDGQLLPIATNTSLFSLLGTQYGGDGRTTFGLPDLRGRVPLHVGTGPGLTARGVGDSGGSSLGHIMGANVPAHTHAMVATKDTFDARRPEGAILAGSPTEPIFAAAPATEGTVASMGPAGGDDEHQNLMPTTCISAIIALNGSYPSR